MRFAFILLIALGASSAAAQTRYLRADGEDSTVRAEALDRGWTSVDEVVAELPRPRSDAVADLSRVETLISQAREAATRLREGAALDALAEARALLERHARLPGVARWLAEVELATGVVAHQQGRPTLAEQSLSRAASLDPDRRLGAAEAAPPVVQRAEELARAAATRPEAELTIRSAAAGARGYLDDRPLGPLPVRVETGVGRHVLRVEAPGHRPWGRVIDLREGRRRPWDVTLSPIEKEARRRRLARAALSDVPESLEGEASMLWVSVRGDRALVTHCTSLGCTAPEVRTAGDIFEARENGGLLTGEPLLAAWNAGLADLVREPTGRELPPPPRPWWERGSTWVSVALGAIVAGVALGFSLRPDVRQELRVVVDTDLGL